MRTGSERKTLVTWRVVGLGVGVGVGSPGPAWKLPSVRAKLPAGVQYGVLPTLVAGDGWPDGWPDDGRNTRFFACAQGGDGRGGGEGAAEGGRFGRSGGRRRRAMHCCQSCATDWICSGLTWDA